MKSVAWSLALFWAASAFGASQAVGSKAAVASVSHYGTRVGLHVLREGGNAIDAAVAISFALAVAHPQAGNIGGGGFLIYYDAATRSTWALDYREVAPTRATRNMYLGPDGKPRAQASTVGGLATAVPGSVAGLEEMHKRFGTKKWSVLVAPAVALAKEGFATDEKLTIALAGAKKDRQIDRFPLTASTFYPNGAPVPAGTLLKQPLLARTLEEIARSGANGFYRGANAKRILAAMKKHDGIITAEDLEKYRPTWRAPIQITYGDFEFHTMPPPSAASIIFTEVLGILSGFDVKSFGFQTPGMVHLLAEAERRAYIDRNRFLGDPEVTRIPYAELFAEDRARQWRASIDLKRATPTATLDRTEAAQTGQTTHLSVVDSNGNVASLTTTLNSFFGNGVLVEEGGYFLNNEMDDFTTAPGQPTSYGLVQSEANAIAPRKKMASSMCPTIIMKAGTPWLVFGSPGGSTIPTTLLQVFFNLTLFGKTLRDSVDAPRFHHQGYPDEIAFEKGRVDVRFLNQLNELGHAVKEWEDIGDVHAILLEDGSLTAVSDSRRGGAAGAF